MSVDKRTRHSATYLYQNAMRGSVYEMPSSTDDRYPTPVSSMVLKLYGLAGATAAGRVRVVLEELNVPYEFVVVSLPGASHTAPPPSDSPTHEHHDTAGTHPFGQLPYIDDDGLVLFESRAICRYLALKHGGVGTLIPDTADLVATARFEQAASIELCNFEPHASGLAHENIFKRRAPRRVMLGSG